jgi:cysteine desulfurase/selenocysteine lyase
MVPFDVERIRESFPILHQQVNGKDLVYFDNAATSQKPARVINALTDYYTGYNANIHRGIHTLAEKATKAYEASRVLAREFINAQANEEIIFVRGVSEAINLVAQSYGKAFLKTGDEIIISGLEHHSNIVPWQFVCEETGAILKVIDVTPSGELDMASYQRLLTDKTRIVAVNHASNSLGTINPINEIIDQAHAVGAVVLLDGAQAGAHLDINVQELDCDFYCLSSHKMYGPTGTGILYGKKALLEKMKPYQGGGEMIANVTFEKTTYNDLPYKFEAGTPNIADVIAFGEAIRFITELGKSNIRKHEDELLAYATRKVGALPGVRLIGTAKNKVGVLSFIVEGIHPFDIGQMLDARGIAVRTGHHCTQPLMDHFNI